MSDNSYYDILQLSIDAVADDIKKAYQELSLKWHPAKNPNNKDESQLKFKEVSEAYQILSDVGKRRLYDTYGKTGSIGGDSASFQDPNEVFKAFFDDKSVSEIFKDNEKLFSEFGNSDYTKTGKRESFGSDFSNENKGETFSGSVQSRKESEKKSSIDKYTNHGFVLIGEPKLHEDENQSKKKYVRRKESERKSSMDKVDQYEDQLKKEFSVQRIKEVNKRSSKCENNSSVSVDEKIDNLLDTINCINKEEIENIEVETKKEIECLKEEINERIQYKKKEKQAIEKENEKIIEAKKKSIKIIENEIEQRRKEKMKMIKILEEEIEKLDKEKSNKFKSIDDEIEQLNKEKNKKVRCIEEDIEKLNEEKKIRKENIKNKNKKNKDYANEKAEKLRKSLFN